MYSEILVPVGPELTSNSAALDEAAEFAEELGSSINLVYVWLDDDEEAKYAESDAQYPEPIEHALEYLGDDLEVEHTAISGNDTADAIVTHANEIGVDAICMGTNAATGLKRMVLGSITEGVIRKTELPVVAVNYHGDGEEG